MTYDEITSMLFTGMIGEEEAARLLVANEICKTEDEAEEMVKELAPKIHH